MKISDITVGERHRKNLGDIDALAASINTLGLLHPLVVNGSHELIAGERRLAAVRRLGWKDVGVTVAHNLDDVHRALLAERDENTCRQDFTPSEMVAMAKAIEPFEKTAASKRAEESGRIGGKDKGSVKFTDPSKGAAADKVADAVGTSRPTLEKAKAVSEAAEQHPKEYGDLAEQMDKTGSVSGAYNELSERAAQPDAPSVRLPHKPMKPRPGIDSPPPRSAASRFCLALANVTKEFSSIRDLGGVRKLSASWSTAERDDYANNMSELRKELDEWIHDLETQCRSKKSA